MMRVLNDFICGTCHKYHTDCYVDNELTTIDCLHCGEPATKVRHIPNFYLPGNDAAGFPTAHDRWAKMREQKIALEKKQEPTP